MLCQQPTLLDSRELIQLAEKKTHTHMTEIYARERVGWTERKKSRAIHNEQAYIKPTKGENYLAHIQTQHTHGLGKMYEKYEKLLRAYIDVYFPVFSLFVGVRCLVWHSHFICLKNCSELDLIFYSASAIYHWNGAFFFRCIVVPISWNSIVLIRMT